MFEKIEADLALTGDATSRLQNASEQFSSAPENVESLGALALTDEIGDSTAHRSKFDRFLDRRADKKAHKLAVADVYAFRAEQIFGSEKELAGYNKDDRKVFKAITKTNAREGRISASQARKELLEADALPLMLGEAIHKRARREQARASRRYRRARGEAPYSILPKHKVPEKKSASDSRQSNKEQGRPAQETPSNDPALAEAIHDLRKEIQELRMSWSCFPKPMTSSSQKQTVKKELAGELDALNAQTMPEIEIPKRGNRPRPGPRLTPEKGPSREDLIYQKQLARYTEALEQIEQLKKDPTYGRLVTDTGALKQLHDAIQDEAWPLYEARLAKLNKEIEKANQTRNEAEKKPLIESVEKMPQSEKRPIVDPIDVRHTAQFAKDELSSSTVVPGEVLRVVTLARLKAVGKLRKPTPLTPSKYIGS